MNPAEIAKKIKEAVGVKGWTVMDLARNSGIPQPQLYRYLKGTNKWPAAKLQKVADALNLAMDDLAPSQLDAIGTEESKLLDIIERYAIDHKRKAICKLALTAESSDLEYMHNTILAPYLEGIESGAADHKKPSAG
jgi:transcriptional regulator with XRE-family HTH domain